MSAHLAAAAGVLIETPIERIRRLEAETRTAALAERDDVIDALIAAAGRCQEIAGLESLPAGLRDAFRQIGVGIENGVQTAQSISIRGQG